MSAAENRFSARRWLPLALAAALALSACGRRGDLEPPASAAVQKPTNGEPEFHRSVPKVLPPKGSFVLDPLLR